MADGVTGVITALIGAAGNAAPSVAAAIQQREAERRAQREQKNAALVPAPGQTLNPQVIPARPAGAWPTWVKVAALGAGVVVVGGVGYAIYRSVSSGGGRKRRRR